MTVISGWGRYPRRSCRVSTPGDASTLRDRLADSAAIARGNGRAYGDSAMNLSNTLDMRRFNRMLDFDPATGRLTAEAGVMLADVISAFLPRGWFPSVTPGTKFVTIGGMIAADVHGKNHHRDGSFGAFVDWLDLMGPDGTVTRCARDENPELFEWTLGGMGLTGVILRAAFRLRPVATGWIRQHLIAAPNLDSALDTLEDTQEATYSVAWVDCLARGQHMGRSLVMLGEHAQPGDLPRERRARPYDIPARRRFSVPFTMPSATLNPMTVRGFNALNYRHGTRRAGTALVDWDSYFYPLDSIRGWNRLYGRRGLAQFQCVLPPEAARAGLAALLRRISEARQGAFLSVLKRLGPQESGFSFPMEGYTLALDFAVRTRSLDLMNELDEIVLAHGGRFYLAKDSRMSASTLAASDPRAAAFSQMRAETGRASRFRSLQSERLEL